MKTHRRPHYSRLEIIEERLKIDIDIVGNIKIESLNLQIEAKYIREASDSVSSHLSIKSI